MSSRASLITDDNRVLCFMHSAIACRVFFFHYVNSFYLCQKQKSFPFLMEIVSDCVSNRPKNIYHSIRDRKCLYFDFLVNIFPFVFKINGISVLKRKKHITMF